MNNIKVFYDYDSKFIELSKSAHNAKFQYSKMDGQIKFCIEASARPDIILDLMNQFDSIKKDISSVNVGDYKICILNDTKSFDIFISDSRIETTEYMKSDVFPILNINMYMSVE